MDRIDRLRVPNGPRFAPREPPADDIAAYVAARVSAAAWRYRARFVVRAPAAVVAERINPAVGTVEAVEEHTCVLHSGADSVEVMAVYIGRLGLPFTVDGPPELLAHLRTLSQRYRVAVERATSGVRPATGVARDLDPHH